MKVGSNTGTTLMISSALLLGIPLAVFPAQLGLPLAKANLFVVLVEAVYYVAVSFVLNRESSTDRVALSAGVCLLYRYALGAAFGVLAALLYSLSWSGAFRFGVFSYLPAVMLQISVTPFVIQALLKPSTRERHSARPVRRETSASPSSSGLTSISISREKGVYTESQAPTIQQDVEPRRGFVQTHAPGASQSSTELNGFDRATRYLGEHGSVHMAAVVDNEGLLLSNFRRGSVEPEDWAPLALLLFDANRRVLNRATRALGTPERLDVIMKDTRILVARDQWFSLMVLAERHSDETLQIKFNQSLEMIRKYITDRYTPKQENNAERIHVSSTQ